MLTLVLAAQLAVTQVRPLPVTPAMDPPVTETKFGITTTDPDRWLEDLKDPKVQAWAKAQSDYTRKVLDSIPGRAGLLADIQRYERMTASSLGYATRLADGRLVLKRRAAGEQLGKLYLRDGIDGKERLLLDPATVATSAKPHDINWFEVSPDGKTVAVGVSEAGSENAVLHLVDIGTGKTVEAPLDRMRFGISWLPDSRGYIYSRQNVLAADAPPTDRYLNMQARLHRLGQPHAADPVIFGNTYAGSPGLDPKQIPIVQLTPGSRWMLAEAYTVGNRINLYAAPVADLGQPRIRWRKVVDEARNNVRATALRGDTLYLLDSDSPMRSVTALDLRHPEAAAVPFVPTGNGSIEALHAARDALYYTVQPATGVGVELYRRAWGASAARRIVIPGGDTTELDFAAPDQDGALVSATGWSMFPQVFAVDGKGKVARTPLQPLPTGADAGLVESRVVEVRSHDGALVPLSLLLPRAQRRDGSMPVLLNGYGSYGMPSGTPALYPGLLVLPQHGIGFATCHVRGGGEKGEAWYRAGFKATKANTWKDFIACAEYLVKEGYTSPARLFGMGASAGGILIGNAAVERPDLFAGVLPNVGWLDALGSLQRDPNGPPNRAEFGDPAVEGEYRGLVAMSAYQKIKPGVAYPAALLIHGINDPRVAPWNSFKFGARLQRDSSSGKPVLLDIDYNSGHGIGSSLATRQAQLADQLSFLLWQAGVPAFQPSWTGE